MSELTPLLAAALAKLIDNAPTLLERWVPNDPEVRAARVIAKAYPKIRPHLTPSSVRIVVAIGTGKNCPPQELCKILKKPSSRAKEVEYRCKFMCMLGVLQQIGGSEFAITNLGKSFFAAAETKRDYPEVKF